MLIHGVWTRYNRLTVLSALLLVAGIYAACAQPRIGEFDWDRYRTITPEKRRQYDQLFFNEMETWNMNSTRYGLDSPGKKREHDFRNMAADGYLPAYVAVRIFGFEGGYVFSDTEAYKILMQAAEKGTGSERCALSPIHHWAGFGMDGRFLKEIDQAFLDRQFQLGVDAGHFGCQYLYAVRYQYGRGGFAKDLARATEYFIQSAAQGYYPAQIGLAFFYREIGITSVRDAERMLCWSALAHQHSSWAHFSLYVHAVENAYSENSPIRDPHIKQELESLRQAWAPIGGEMTPKKTVTITDCLALEHNANGTPTAPHMTR